jgi:squalene-hopene/tetraprenyl-beta-curcumene cyclase
VNEVFCGYNGVMRKTIALAMLAIPLAIAGSEAGWEASDEASSWSPKNAAGYLDQRADWWMGWKSSQRDHDTFCISCHTALPYALGRPALRAALEEKTPSSGERQLLANVTKRVRIWSEALPFYSDEARGAPKTAESRGTEAVLNALILVSYDSKLNDDTRLALQNMWSLQLKTGEQKGAFTWLNFHNEPWEADDSQYWGATLAALAVGSAPKEYQASVQENVKLLSEYLQREQAGQSLLNRVVLLWASTKIPTLLRPEQQKAIVDELLGKQQADGGWNASSLVLGTWKRRDSTAFPSASDGYGTGLVSFVLEQAGVPRTSAPLKRGLTWLSQNQDKSSGVWTATSLNKERDPASDAGKFMSDAATAFAVMALAY